jgi:hypothetical protein
MAQYEFTAEENAHIDQLRRKIQHIALLFLALAALQVVQSFLLADAAARWTSLAGALLLGALGWLFWRPLDNLARIITTTGNDIREVVVAIKDLRVAYLGAEIILMLLAAGCIVEVMRLTTGTGL